MDQVLITLAARLYPTAEKMQEIKTTVNEQYSVDSTVMTTYSTQVAITVTSDTLPTETLEQIKQTATDILNA